MSSSLSKATSDNLKIIRSVHTHTKCVCVFYFFVLFSLAVVSPKYFLLFVLFSSILRSFSRSVVAVRVYLLLLLLFNLPLTLSLIHSLTPVLAPAFFYHSVPTFFSICFNVLFAVHVIAYRPKTKATNINKC